MPGNIINISPADLASWPKPNYVNPVERTWMPAYACTLYGVTTMMFSLRLWLRATNQAGRFGVDDALLVGAWLGGSMFLVVTLLGAHSYDIGRHAWDVPISKYEKVAQVTWLAEMAFLISGGCTKISVLLFYRRLVDGVYTRRWKALVILVILFTAGYTVAFILTLIFNCSPTEAYWKAFDPTYTHNFTCVNTTVINLLAGVSAAVSDLLAVVLPCIMVSTFGIPRTQKIALYIVFSLGFVGVAASGVRTYYLYEVGQKSDVTWLVFDVLCWAHLEIQLGIMCASAPALRVFLRKMHRAVQDKRGSTSTAPQQDHKDVDKLVIRRAPSPGDQLQRYDFSGKRQTFEAVRVGGVSVAELEADNSPVSSMSSSDHGVVRVPAAYVEEYHMQNLAQYRQEDVYERPRSRDRNFSHPFVS